MQLSLQCIVSYRFRGLNQLFELNSKSATKTRITSFLITARTPAQISSALVYEMHAGNLECRCFYRLEG